MNCVYSPVLCVEEADDELFTHPCCVWRRLMMNCVYSPVLCAEEADDELCLLTRVV